MEKRIERRGGKRVGAGRKKKGGPVVTYAVKLRPDQVELLRKWGGGDVSMGIRWLVDAARPLIKRD